IQKISLTGFPAQSVGSSNTDVLDLPCLLVLITETSQSRQHGLFVTACELYGVQQVYFDIVSDKNEYTKNHKKIVKNKQARTRESEEFKKKPKNRSRSQKSQIQSKKSQHGQQKSTRPKTFHFNPQLSQKSKNVLSSLIGPEKPNSPIPES
ncbi:hypothetical protein Tco_1189849, partial [Tanacetum coccineum]